MKPLKKNNSRTKEAKKKNSVMNYMVYTIKGLF